MKEGKMFNLKKVALLTLSLWATLNASGAEDAQCGKCMSNFAYCIDETNYYLCPNGKDPIKATVQQCKSDEICTSTADICVKRDQAVADTIGCQDECNNCPSSSAPNNKFTCVSATQYTLCANGKPSDKIGSCGAGESCNAELYKQHGSICAPACVLDFFGYAATCSNEVATTTPAPIFTTPAPNREDLKQQCLDSKPDPYEGFFYTKNSKDPDCKTYMYCEMLSNEMEFIFLTCKSGFFDENEKVCVNKKPASCDTEKTEPENPEPENPEPKKPEPEKPEPEKPEPEKPEPGKTEPEKPEPENPEPKKPEPEKPEPEKPEPEKPEPEKPEPEKPEPEKPEPGKTEPEKPEPEKPEPEKPEPEKPEPEKPESEKTEPKKPEPEKPNPEKTEPVKPKPEKTEPKKTA